MTRARMCVSEDVTFALPPIQKAKSSSPECARVFLLFRAGETAAHFIALTAPRTRACYFVAENNSVILLVELA